MVLNANAVPARRSMTIVVLALCAALPALGAHAGSLAGTTPAATTATRELQRTAGWRTDDAIPPASDFVLYHRQDDDHIWLLDNAGNAQIMAGAHPRLSPDGHYLFYQSTIWYGDLYVRDLATGVDSMLLDASAITVGGSWTADGSHVLFDHGCSMYQVEPDGSNLETIIPSWPPTDACWNDDPDSSPADGRIVWENERHGLGLAQADGADPHWVPNTVPYDYSPRWSPDGLWVAFWRDDNVYRIRPDGSDLSQLTFLSGANDWMEDTGQWTHDGQYLVAAALIDGVEGLYAIRPNGSGQITRVLADDWTQPDWVGGAGELVLGDTIFADGFESGDSDAWSAAVP